MAGAAITIIYSYRPASKMAAARHSLLRLQMRMKSPQLLLAAIAISSSSWSSSIQLVESFSHYHHTQKQFQFEWAQHRFVHLPASSLSDDASGEKSSNHQSVTGPIYEMENVPNVKLFTKQGCTLCDKVKDVSTGCRQCAFWQHFLYNISGISFDIHYIYLL